jgi:hypothetical protein
MDELFERFLNEIKNKVMLESVTLPEDLTHIRLPLKLLDMRCYNWKAENIRKIYFVRIKVAVPAFDIFGMAIYPEPLLDLPSFACDFSCTKKKVFTYINFISLFNEPSYSTKYIEPMKDIYNRYRHIPPQRARAWMQPYLTPYTIYCFPEKIFLKDLRACAREYLMLYLDMFSKSKVIEDASYRESVAQAHKKYVDALSSNDASRKMLGRIIGREKADRFFKEVVT